MATFYDRLVKSLKTPLGGLGISDISGQIARNLKQPIGTEANKVLNVFGSEAEFMSEYQNFEGVYKNALRKELQSTAISTGQKRMIEAAMDSPVINLNLIRNYEQRQALVGILRQRVVPMKAVIENFGAPGIGLPSSNLYRAAAKYSVDQRNSMNHPAINLMNSLTMNIDPNKRGLEAFGFGVSNLPSVASLKQAKQISESISKGTGIFKVAQGKKLNVLTFDVETSGLGIYDQVRSLAASTMEIQHGSVVTHGADGFSTHFITPQMQQYSMGGTSGSRTRLGTAVYELERNKNNLAENLIDLTTREGQQKAIENYKSFFRKAINADMVAGHNVQFDIQKIAMSAAGIEGFHLDKEAVSLLKQFQQLSEKGKVINTLDIARDYLMREAVQGAELLGGDEIARATNMVNQLFAPETLSRVAIGGSATPFSIGNIAGATNLLELIETQGGPKGSDLIANLARGGNAAHQAQTDTLLTNYMMQFIHSGQLKFGFGTLGGAVNSSEARKTIMKSSAIVPTTNIANAKHMSDAVFEYARSEAGLRSTKITTADGIVSYSRLKQEFVTNKVDKLTGGFVEEQIADQAQIRSTIIDALNQSRKGQRSDLLETGINYLQASRADRILSNVSSATSISTTHGDLMGAIKTGNNVAVEDAFVDALAGTREFLGFNPYQYRPDILAKKGMTAMMSQTYGLISDTDAASYAQKLAKGGLSTAFEDPYLRRNFVELANITSAVPYMSESVDIDKTLGGQMVRKIVANAKGAGPITVDDFASRVAEFNAKTGIGIGDYLSEIGVSFAGTQKENYLFGKTGGISRPIVSTALLKNVEVTVESQGARKKVGFLSQEFLSDYNRNLFGLSVADTKEGKIANLVFGNLAADANAGQRVVNRRMSLELASGIVDQLEQLTKRKNSKETS